METQYRIGQKVRMVSPADYFSVGDFAIIKDLQDRDGDYKIETLDKRNWQYSKDDMFQAAEGWAGLSVGDTMITAGGVDATVVARIEDVIFYTRPSSTSVTIRTVEQLKKFGYTLKEPEEAITELTLEDVAKLAGKPVESIRIKKEDK